MGLAHTSCSVKSLSAFKHLDISISIFQTQLRITFLDHILSRTSICFLEKRTHSHQLSSFVSSPLEDLRSPSNTDSGRKSCDSFSEMSQWGLCLFSRRQTQASYRGNLLCLCPLSSRGVFALTSSLAPFLSRNKYY